MCYSTAPSIVGFTPTPAFRPANCSSMRNRCARLQSWQSRTPAIIVAIVSGMWPRKVDALLSFDPNKKGWSSDSVLGERLLCQRGSLVLHGASGIGKSSLMMQAAICWVYKPNSVFRKDRYGFSFLAALSPSFTASASLMYLPCLVLPYHFEPSL